MKLKRVPGQPGTDVAFYPDVVEHDYRADDLLALFESSVLGFGGILSVRASSWSYPSSQFSVTQPVFSIDELSECDPNVNSSSGETRATLATSTLDGELTFGKGLEEVRIVPSITRTGSALDTL